MKSLLPLLLASFFALPAAADDFIVSNNLDNGSSGSLRAIIALATANSTVCFAPGLSGQTIRLQSGELVVDKNLTIDASDLPDGVTISGDKTGNGFTGDDSRVFNVGAGRLVEFNSITITGGHADTHGGGILTDGLLTLKKCTITGNLAGDNDYIGYFGGGIYNSSGLSMEQCTVSDNEAGRSDYSPFTPVGGNGGGIANTSVLLMDRCTVVNNRTGVAEIAGSGGGIFNEGTTFSLTDSIVANNDAQSFLGDAPSDLVPGPGFSRHGINLVGDNNGEETEFPTPASPGQPNANGDLVGTPASPLDPVLGPLADNGGPTLTHLPLRGSPAINPPNGPADASPFTTDQRGQPRVVAGVADIGAVEAPDYAAIDAAARAAELSSLSRKLKKLKKKLKKAKSKGQASKAKKFKKQIKKVKKQLKAL